MVHRNIVNIVVPNHDKKSLILPDGTKVMINAASTLSYNKNFLEDRVVNLNGEAFFEVPKLEGKSFVVILSDKTKIKVLGTSFDVKAYKEDARIETALFEGRVEIISDLLSENHVVIEPNTTAIIDKNANSMQLLIDDEHIKDALSWQNGEFLFHNEYLSDIIHELNRFYDVEITIISSELESQYFTASFKKGVKLEDVLTDLSISGNFKFKEIDSSHFEVSL